MTELQCIRLALFAWGIVLIYLLERVRSLRLRIEQLERRRPKRRRAAFPVEDAPLVSNISRAAPVAPRVIYGHGFDDEVWEVEKGKQ